MYGLNHHYGFASSVGNLKSDSVGLASVRRYAAISEVLVLYYRSFETVSTLPKKGSRAWIYHMEDSYD